MPTLAGVLLGVGFLAIADDRMTAIAIGIILVFLILLGVLQRRGTASAASWTSRPGIR